MPNPPEGYVVLPTSTPYTDLSQELQKWQTATTSTPTREGNFYIYVTEEEWASYIRELSDSTR